MLPAREVLTPTEEVLPGDDDLPAEYVEPYHIYARIRMGLECTKPEDWTDAYAQKFKQGVSAVMGISVEDVEITSLTCIRASAADKLKDAQAIAALEASGFGSETELEFSVIALYENKAEETRAKLDFVLDSGALLAKLADQQLDVDSLIVLARPVVVAPGQKFEYTEEGKPVVYQAPSPSAAPKVVEEPPLPPGTAEAEVRSAIEVSVVLDMTYTSSSEWRLENEPRLKLAVGKIVHVEDGLHRIKIIRVSRGTFGTNERATLVEFALLPPSLAIENAMEEKLVLEKAGLDGSLAKALRDEGVKTGELHLIKCDVATKTYTDVKSRCKRCRNGREQSEKDHRDFTRKCNRDGSCQKDVPFTIHDACARGCADHCSQTCKRFHDPKAKQCAAKRRLHQSSSVPNAMQPEPSMIQSAQYVSNLIQLDEDMRQFIKTSVDSQNLLSIDQVQDSSEAAVIAQCFGECAHSCIETCIGQWSDAVPDPSKTEEALAAQEPPASTSATETVTPTTTTPSTTQSSKP